jgi:hypothetical protein
VSDPEETHYEVVGVEPSASKDEIRDAYRARVDALAQGKQSEESRSETARLNSAWQVLSDPYQRGRYDQAIGVDAEEAAGDAEASDEDSESDSTAVATRNGRARQREGARARPAPGEPGARVGLFSVEHEPPPPSWPPGLSPPPPRARVIAMAIDLLVLAIIFFGCFLGGARIIESTHQEEFDRIDVLDERVDVAEETRDRAEDRADNADDAAAKAKQDGDAAAQEAAQAREQDARAAASAADDDADKAQEEIDDIERDLQPAQLLVGGATLVLSLLYLVPSSIRSGRTLGKHLMRIRVVNADGTRLTTRGALLHYGIPVLAVLALQSFLGQLAPLVVLVGVVTWPRNPNRQGLHDRLAGTLVVDG